MVMTIGINIFDLLTVCLCCPGKPVCWGGEQNLIEALLLSLKKKKKSGYSKISEYKLLSLAPKVH